MSEDIPQVPGEDGNEDEDRFHDALRRLVCNLADEVGTYTPEDHQRLNQEVRDRVAALRNGEVGAFRPRAGLRGTRLPVCRRPSYEQPEPETDW